VPLVLRAPDVGDEAACVAAAGEFEDDNVASASVIERCGGVLEAVVSAGDGDVPFRRYWID
jgi:predicted acetyltransferase